MGIKNNPTALLVLVVLAMIVVVGLWQPLVFLVTRNIFLFYSSLLGAGLFIVAFFYLRTRAHVFLARATARLERKSMLTLFVKSVKTSEETESMDESEVYESMGARAQPYGFRGPLSNEDTITIDRYVYPEEQAEIIEMIKREAVKYGFAVRTVDLAKEEPDQKIRVIPTLINDSGKRLEGKISEQQLKCYLAHSQRPEICTDDSQEPSDHMIQDST